MKKISLLLSAVCYFVSCDAQNTSTATASITTTVTDTKPVVADIFTKADAEKMLGEPAQQTDNKIDGNICHSTYTAKKADAKSGKTGNVYFMYELHEGEDAAHEVYKDIMTANEANGIQPLEGLGDEAYFHTDGENFLFIMARKGAKTIRIKVNKITTHTSTEGFHAAAKNIVARL